MFVSLTDILTISFLKFGDTVCCKAPSNTFVPISNYTKPTSATQCFIETNDIVIDPISEHFNNNISPCNSKVCLTVSQELICKWSNLWATYLWMIECCLCIHCIRCGLMYVGETGGCLRSRINGHQAGTIKDCQSLLYKHFCLPGQSFSCWHEGSNTWKDIPFLRKSSKYSTSPET